jgi:hypothetical protein
MTPSTTNNTASEVLINHGIQCFSNDMV